MAIVADTSVRTATVPELMKLIRKLQVAESKGSGCVIGAREGIGAGLIKLKELAEHGEWAGYLADLRFNQRIAERLMAVSRSALGARIRSGGPNFAATLPLDLQALEALSRLPTRLLNRAVRRANEEEMSRPQIESMVRELRDNPRKSPSAKASALRISASDDDPDDARDADINSEDETAEAVVDEDEEGGDADEQELDSDELYEDDEVGDEEWTSATAEFLSVCETLMDRLIDGVETELQSEDADPGERKRAVAAASRLVKRLRRMRIDPEESADGD